MDDRQPRYPGRIKLRDVGTGEEKTYDMTMADEPTVAGTPPTKENLLTDVTAAMYGLGKTATVNDTFTALAIGVGKKGCLIRVSYPDGSPAEGYAITGATGPDGAALVTDSAGYALAVSTQQTITISIPDAKELDIQPVPQQTINLLDTITTVRIRLKKVDGILAIHSSVSKPVTKFCKSADFCGVGAGGGGSGGRTASPSGPGPGGGGGYIENALSVATEGTPVVSVSVGRGGKPGEKYTAGGKGGDTAVSVGGRNVLTARGGTGGTQDAYKSEGNSSYSRGGDGNGPGGNSDYLSDDQGAKEIEKRLKNVSGQAATGFLFNDPSLGVPGGGGGGGFIAGYYYRPSSRPDTSGAPNGAMGGVRWRGDSGNLAATTAKGPGGGGGGGDSSWSDTAPSAGANGAAYARFNWGAA